MPIWEIAEIITKNGEENAFQAGVKEAVPLLLRQPGCRSVILERCIEEPAKFYLRVSWDSVEHHMDGFRQSEDFKEWRRMVGHCFAHPPQVQHSQTVL